MLVVVTGYECWKLLQVMSVGSCYRLRVLVFITGYECWWLLQVMSIGGWSSVDGCYRL